jgi:thiol-disulfide isomerase/thioredoxin
VKAHTVCVTRLLKKCCVHNLKAAALVVEEVVQGAVADTQFTSESITVLFFWATWCSVCPKFFPALDRLEKKYKGKGEHAP